MANSDTPKVPAAATGITLSEWGIDNQLTGFIVQSEDYTNDLVTDTTQDQKGRVVGQLDYDKHYTCTLTVIGSGTLPAPGDTFSWKDSDGGTNKSWKVQSVTFNGAYNDKKKYTINLERWTNFPSA